MGKRTLSVILLLVMAFQLISCTRVYKTSNASQGIISPVNNNKKPMVTILYHTENRHSLTENKYIKNYNEDFERNFGVEVRFVPESLLVGDNIDLKDMEEIEKKFAAKLVSDTAPDLIFTDGLRMNGLIDQKAVAEVGVRIPNLDKVYEGILADEVYYVPVAMNYYSYVLRRAMLKDLGIGEPDLNWTKRDYLEIRDKWLSANKNSIYFR